MAAALLAVGLVWWRQVCNLIARLNWFVVALGCLGVISFACYSAALGAPGLQIVRRAAVYAFLATTIAAQIGLARQINRLDPRPANARLLLGYAYSLPPVCLGLLPLGYLLLGDWDRGENFAEWNTLWLMLAYFPFAGSVIRKISPSAS